MTPARWRRLMQALHLPPNTATFDALHAAYAERHRHYHTGEHIHDCLEKLAISRHLAPSPDAIELAIWFHDAVYNPYRADNEEKSADWAARFLNDNAADPALVEHTRHLILATCHDAPAHDPDAALLIDIDLSILGADEDRFLAFEHAIRREYRWVPGPLYRRRRGDILRSFLQRERVFHTEVFHERLETRARVNLAGALERLQKS